MAVPPDDSPNLALDYAAEQERSERFRQQVRLLDAVASATPDLLSIFDRAGRVVYVNAPLLALWKRTSLEEVRGLSMLDLGLPAEHVERRDRDFARILSSGQTETSEVEWDQVGRASIVYETTLVPVFAADGSIEAIAGTTRDVTERRRREDRDALLVHFGDATRVLTDPDEIARVTVRLLAEHLAADRCAYADIEADEDTFCLTGEYLRNGTVPVASRSRCSDLGHDFHALMLRGAAYVIGDVEQDAAAAQNRDVCRAAGIRAIVTVPLLQDGKFVAALGIYQAKPRLWRDDEVELARLIAARCWESIERARSGHRLADSEHRLRLALDTGRLGVWEVDLRTMQMSCSEICKATYGWPPDEPFTYEQLLSTIHPDDIDHFQANLRRALERRTDHIVEYRVRVDHDEVRWILMRGRAAYAGNEGIPTRMVGVSVDITDRKTEEERRARSLEAEQAARFAAETASRLKDEFLATLSHELRTPLSAILGWSQILRRTPASDHSPAGLAEGLAAIERNARAQTKIIEDLLDMSRIMSGKVSLDARPIDLATVVAAALDTVKPTSAAKEVEVRFVDSPEPKVILGDTNRLQQVFWNLLTNAVKFTPRGGRITVRAILDADIGGRQYRVDVEDSGEGIRADFLPHVFDRFRQADASTTRRHGGLGLGLSIVKQLVELHGGSVSVSSDGPGMGATFSVWLPALLTDSQRPGEAGRGGDAGATNAEAHPRSTAPMLSEDPRCAILAGVRVLIVDDEPDARAMLRHVLESCKVVVVDAPSTADALTLLCRERVEVIISDVGMPLQDGYALMRSIRALPEAAATPAVALTAYASVEDRKRALAAGFDMHVAKPVEPEELLAAVATLVARSVKN
jgi:PAS domain S-box-containing protein